MEAIAGFSFLPLAFNEHGAVNPQERDAVVHAVADPSVADVLVISHGWNNDTADARALYDALLAQVHGIVDRDDRHARLRTMMVVGVFWPSKQFTDDALRPEALAGSAASTQGGGRAVKAALAARLDQLDTLLGSPDAVALADAKAQLPMLQDSPHARKDFAAALRKMLPLPVDAHDDNSNRFFHPKSGDDFVIMLADPVSLDRGTDGSAGGIARLDLGAGPGHADDGGAASLAGLWTGAEAGAWRLLNYATYYVMKERAGIVGGSLNAVLTAVRAARPNLRIHLAGHSFGARLVTAAAGGDTTFVPASLALLQAAFSHNGFAPDVDGLPGFFRNVIAQNRVHGPIIVTHTQNDHAVGVAYAIASRFAGDSRESVGGPDDKYGGLGRNGAMRMGEEATAAELKPDDFVYPHWTPGRVTNLLADAFIKGHSDITGAQVANALVTAMSG